MQPAGQAESKGLNSFGFTRPAQMQGIAHCSRMLQRKQAQAMGPAQPRWRPAPEPAHPRRRDCVPPRPFSTLPLM